jgi:hypothetical protein
MIGSRFATSEVRSPLLTLLAIQRPELWNLAEMRGFRFQTKRNKPSNYVTSELQKDAVLCNVMQAYDTILEYARMVSGIRSCRIRGNIRCTKFQKATG